MWMVSPRTGTATQSRVGQCSTATTSVQKLEHVAVVLGFPCKECAVVTHHRLRSVAPEDRFGIFFRSRRKHLCFALLFFQAAEPGKPLVEVGHDGFTNPRIPIVP